MTSTLVRKQLRDYQVEARSALERDWAAGLLRLGVGLPTGTGKTLIMSTLAYDYAAAGIPVLVLTHLDTVTEQTERDMRENIVPGMGVTVGVVKGDRNVVRASIVVASIHTLRSDKRLHQLVYPGLIIVDEAHVSMSATYARVFARFPDVRYAGFSATWIRSDSKQLGDFWQKISFYRSIRWAIRHGHLVLPVGVEVGAPPVGLLDGVKPTRSGDWSDADLGEAVTVDTVRDNVVRGFLEHAIDRPSVLFAPTKAAAEFFRAGLAAAGVQTAGVYDSTSARERVRIFKAFRARQIQVLTTCTALSVGWDAPWCSALLLVRPTRHIGLYIQLVGRVIRKWSGKRDALVLDFVGSARANSLTLDAVLRPSGPDDDPIEREEREGVLPSEAQELMFRIGQGTHAVDLFASTPVQWLTTDLGVPFVATRTAFYFLVPYADGTWSVGTCPAAGLAGGRMLLTGVTAEDATRYASVVAIDDDPHHAAAQSAWRGPERKPTEQQIKFCRSNHIVISASDNRCAVADKIDQRRGSIVLHQIGVPR